MDVCDSKLYKKTYFKKRVFIKKVKKDALIDELPEDKKKLIVMVVVEATRADRFLLNGYKKDTNHLLKKELNLEQQNKIKDKNIISRQSVPYTFWII